jgi:phytoene synthase
MKELEVAYEHCRRITRKEAKNFYYAFITLPHRKRQAIYAAYAFCRLCDDATDEALPFEEKLRLLKELRARLATASEGHPEGPVFTALADAARTFSIPMEYFNEIIKGVETDLTQHRYQTFQELRSYCYRVASVVGLICVQVFGYSDPRAKDFAIDLGLAMQLTNILRDIREDLERDRIYLPLEEMAEAGYSEEDLRAGVANEAFLRLMHRQAQRARAYFRSGLRLLPLLSPRSRACPAVLAGIYSRILERIEANPAVVLDGRISLKAREKLLLTAKLWLKSMLPLPSPPLS